MTDINSLSKMIGSVGAGVVLGWIGTSLSLSARVDAIGKQAERVPVLESSLIRIETMLLAREVAPAPRLGQPSR